MDIYVFIYLPGQTKAVPAGLFEYDPGRCVGMFSYGHRYAQRDDARPVDPVSLPLDLPAAPCEINRGLYGALRDASPDMWGRLVTAKALKIPPESLNESDYLLHSSGLRVGNLDFRISPDAPEPQLDSPAVGNLEDLLEAAERIKADQSVDAQLLQLFQHGTSLGGARPKCTIEDQHCLWVAKFPDSQDRWNHPRVEWATLLLAQHCGIIIPELRMFRTRVGDVLLSRRFDREPGSSGYARHGYLSALSVLQLDEGDRDRFSYPAFADALRRHGIGGQKTLEQVFRRMAFNVFCRNTDDHPRNHGVLFFKDQADLSPAFDIAPTPSRLGVGSDFSLSMSLGPQGRIASIANLLGGAPRFGLDGHQAREILAGMAEQIRGWETFFQDCDIDREEQELFRPGFESVHLREALELG